MRILGAFLSGRVCYVPIQHLVPQRRGVAGLKSQLDVRQAALVFPRVVQAGGAVGSTDGH